MRGINNLNFSDAFEEMNRVVPKLFARNEDSDSDDGPPAAKRRRVRKCKVVLEDVSRCREFWVRSMYREAIDSIEHLPHLE